MNGTMNGTMNGSMNGSSHMNGIKPSLNGHAVVSRRRTAPTTGPGVFARSFSIVARLLTWYSILTILFRCPPTLDACTEDAPRICKPYFQVKQTVSPYLDPYYDAYAAPYVQLVRPYYDTVDRTVLAPTWGYATKYAAPRVAQAQAFGQAQWQKNFQPQLVKYQTLAGSQYNRTLAPHIERFSTAIVPYYEIARTNALQTYHDTVLPTYLFVEPYALQGYNAASAFTTQTAVPSALWAWNKTYVFLDATVWPQLRVIYTENVEPQLVKIGQRLGRYNGNSPQKSAAESISSKASSSFTKPTQSSPSTATSSSAAASAPSSTSAPAAEPPAITEAARVRSAEPVPAPETPEGEEDDVRRIARETVAEDLAAWQDKYTKAADEGAAEIDQRVDEISKRMLRRQARTTGKSLVDQLQQSVIAEIVQLRRDILTIVGAVDKGSAADKDGEEQLVTAVRRAGMEIKQKAQDIRSWREKYDQELQAAINKAAENHFKILGSIRDLALQKIGMKWAWMEGVTYKDWAKYHLLKDRFDEWEKDLEQLIVTHPSLEEAQHAGQAIEDEGMKVAQAAAKELARLKEVGGWKLAARDTTDEFDSSLVKQAAEAAEAAKSTIIEVADAATSSVVSAAEAVADTFSSVIPTEPLESAASAFSSAVGATSEDPSTHYEEETPIPTTIESLASDASSAVVAASGTISTVAEAASSSLGAAVSEASEAASETASEAADAIPEAVKPSPPNLASEASAIILEETPVILGNTTEADGSVEASPIHLPVDEVAETVEAPLATPDGVSSSTTSIKSALFGAAAESVPTRKPIIDDDTYDSAASVVSVVQSDLPSTISSVASSVYSVAVSHAADQYSHALKIVSAQISGTPKPVHEQMLSSVSSAYSQAQRSASSRLDVALKAAADLYGTATAKVLPTETKAPAVEWSRVEAIAAERLQQGRVWAEEQYESAKVAVGLATPTPTSPADRLVENAKYNYYAALGVAHARYSEFLSSASSAFSSLTATPTPTDLAGTASSAASVASESAYSAASVASESAASVVSAAGEFVSSAASAASENASSLASAATASAASAASVVGENVSSVAAAGYSNVVSVAGATNDKVSEAWEWVVSDISTRVYGAPTPTPWYESLASAASGYAASATDAIGDGAATVTSAAGAYATVASDELTKRYAAVSVVVSELLVGKEPDFTESVYSRLSSAYSTGLASASSFASAASASAVSAASGASDAVRSAGENAASAVGDATAAAKDKLDHLKDEL